MSDKLKRRSWYDGWFYAWFIDANYTSFRDRIFNYIEPEKQIIDIGCGTGGFTLKIAEISNYVLGIDISEKQILTARRRLEKSHVKNVEFIHSSATDLKNSINKRFDYAILTFLVHEVERAERISILEYIKEISDRIVIFDYHHPMAKNISGQIIRLTEFFAGRNHYKNFLDYNKQGGLSPILEEAGLKIIRDRINRPQVFRTVVAKAIS